MKKTHNLFSVLALVLFVSMVSGLQDDSNSAFVNATECLDESMEIMYELMEQNFSVSRINDTLLVANQIYESQKFAKLTAQNQDYSAIINYCEDIKEIRENAYEAKDVLYSLELNYNSFDDKLSGLGVNTTAVDELVDDARRAMGDERYLSVIEIAPKAENKMAEIEAKTTTVNLFYKTATRGLREFILEYYKLILFLIVGSIIFYIFYKWRIRRYLILKRIKRLERRREMLKKLIQKAQFAYFHEGKISQQLFNIKTKKYAEFIRDIERQIPLLNEQLAKVNVKLGKSEKSGSSLEKRSKTREEKDIKSQEDISKKVSKHVNDAKTKKSDTKKGNVKNSSRSSKKTKSSKSSKKTKSSKSSKKTKSSKSSKKGARKKSKNSKKSSRR